MTWGQSAGNLKEEPQRLYATGERYMDLNAQSTLRFVIKKGTCMSASMRIRV